MPAWFAKAMGADMDAGLDTLSEGQFNKFADEIKTVEGWNPGTALKWDDPKVPEEIRNGLGKRLCPVTADLSVRSHSPIYRGLLARPCGGTANDLRPIPLHPGANTIARFAPDGRDAIVTQGWRENGNAHRYTVLLVLMSDGIGRFDVVPVERPGVTRGSSDVIVDNPHTGEDAVRSVRLARALADGSQATLLLSATREVDLSQGLAAPSPVTYDVFRLVHQSSKVGGSPDTFKLPETSHSVSIEQSASTWSESPPPRCGGAAL